MGQWFISDALARKSYNEIVAAKSAEILERVNTGTLAPDVAVTVERVSRERSTIPSIC
jgi:hypothetical protein